MKDKLELKHLAAYTLETLEVILSEKGIFNLDCEHGVPFEAYEPMKIINICLGETPEIEIHSEKHNWGVGFIELDEIKLKLRSLSQLADKEIIDKLMELINEDIESDFLMNLYSTERCRTWNYIKHAPYTVIEILLKWHFDIFGLIGKGLAIKKED